MTWVKICGITSLEDAMTAVDAGADAVGFVFYEKSPRYVDPQAARRIASQVPTRVEKVGVFVDTPAAAVASVADEVGLTIVQLHSSEQRAPEKQVTNKKVFLSLPADVVASSWRDHGESLSLPENLSAIFLDSGTLGGTGRRFNWKDTEAFTAAMSKQYPIVVAGGLTPDNVSDAIRALRPWGVDVSSGVEAAPGKKDSAKVRAFIDVVRQTDGNE